MLQDFFSSSKSSFLRINTENKNNMYIESSEKNDIWHALVIRVKQYLLRNGIHNTHLHMYTHLYGAGSDRRLKAYINHLLILFIV